MIEAEIITPTIFRNIITRGLPKTGQTTMWLAGDDGTYEAGWWQGRMNANNRQRFIAKTIAGDDIVVDRATGLMWAADGNAAGCNNGASLTWSFAVAYCNALNFAGYSSGWRLPNVKELFSIVDYNFNAPAIDASFFPNTQNSRYWSSTTLVSLITNAWYVHFQNGGASNGAKTASYPLRAVRGGL